MHVLIAEDDDTVAQALLDVLSRRGYETHRVARGEDVLLHHHPADLLLLDLGLPDLDGIDVIWRLRRVSQIPVLVLTARGDGRSVVQALHVGADDYLVKPVRLAELLARMIAVTRRRKAELGPTELIRVGDLVVDLKARVASVDGAPLSLTSKEFAVLVVLATRAGSAVSREEVLDEIWGDAFVGASRSLDVHLTRLRAKLGPFAAISTIRGYGYRLEA